MIDTSKKEMVWKWVWVIGVSYLLLTSKPLFTHHGSQEDTLHQLILFSSWNLTSSEYLFIWLRRQRSGNGPGFRSSNIEHRCALHCIACVIRLGTDSAVMKEQSGGGSANVQPYGALCSHYVITILHLMLRQAHKPCGEGVNRINGT